MVERYPRRKAIQEVEGRSWPGIPLLVVNIAVALLTVRWFIDGGVGLVQVAFDGPKEQGVGDLGEERQARMVSNLLVALCSERATQPAINSGSIHQ